MRRENNKQKRSSIGGAEFGLVVNICIAVVFWAIAVVVYNMDDTCMIKYE